jgi:hypothetical protein
MMLGNQREGALVFILEGMVKFEEGTIVVFKVVSKSGVRDLESEESKETSGVLVGLEFFDEEEVGNTSLGKTIFEGSDVGINVVSGLFDLVLISGDFIFKILDGGIDGLTVLVLLGVEVLETRDSALEGSRSVSPVGVQGGKMASSNSVHSD